MCTMCCGPQDDGSAVALAAIKALLDQLELTHPTLWALRTKLDALARVSKVGGRAVVQGVNLALHVTAQSGH